jgi:hypothetical protein
MHGTVRRVGKTLLNRCPPTALPIDCRGISSLMHSQRDDEGVRHWLRRVAESACTPNFVRTITEGDLIAFSLN